MTLLTRNRFFKAALAIMVLLLGGYVLLLTQLVIEDYNWVEMVQKLNVSQNPELNFESLDPVLNLLAAGVAISISAIGLALYVRFFQRVSTSHIFFIILFIISLGLEVVRAFALLAIQHGAPIRILLGLSQINLSAHVFGIVSMFMGSLYTSGLRYQHQGTLLIILVTISLLLIAVLPFNTNIIGYDFLYHLANANVVEIMLISLIVLIVINYIRVLVQRSEEFSPFQALAMVILLIGKYLVHRQDSYLGLSIGGGLLILGLSILAVQLFREHFWY